MSIKMFLHLFAIALALNVTNLSFADESFKQTEEVEAVIETPDEDQMEEPEFEEGEVEDEDGEQDEEEKN